MGYVTKEGSIGDIMVSHTFESYDDFVKWSMIQDDAVPSPSSEENCSSEQFTLTLDEHEVYTLRILLGHCYDKDCASINAKLDEIAGGDLGCYDYNRLYFRFINDNGDVEELYGGEKEVTVRFK
jgi:hypothetical protein